jgi:tetratricopeptide (TPR) repeat protein
MSNFTENQERIGFLKGKAAQVSGNYFARLGRHEIAREEYQQALAAYDTVYQTLPDFAEAQKNKKTVLENLSELFGHLLELGRWLQNKFDKATEAGWLTLEDIFGTAIPAMSRRKMAVKRAKQIDLGANRVALVIELDELSESHEIRVLMRVHPLGEQTHLPDNLKFTVIPKSGEPDEYLAKSHHPAFETEWFYKRGEQFRVKVQLNDVTVTEDFVI